MTGNQPKSKNYLILIVSGIAAIFAIVSLYNTLTSENESDHKISDIESKQVDEISNKMILLMHWKFILDTSSELSDFSDTLQTKKFDTVQEKLKYFSNEYDRHKSNLQALDIIEKYQPVRNKMIQYIETVQDALEPMSIGIQNDDPESISEASSSLIKAIDIENEINTIIKVW